MNQLIGMNITDARFDGENIYLGNVKLTPYGDCCASCYIQHVSGTNAFPGTIMNVQTIDSTPEMQAEDSTDSDGYGSVSESWGHRIITDKGVCTIEMRVDHNGYYGGSLEASPVDYVPDCVALDDF